MFEEQRRQGALGFMSVELLIWCGVVITICAAAIVITKIAGLSAEMAGPISLGSIAFVIFVLVVVPHIVQSLSAKQPAADESMSVFKGPDGLNFLADSGISIDLFPGVLVIIVEFLRAHDPDARLKQYDDWWVHDGMHFINGDTDYDGVLELVGKAQHIREAMPDEFGTCVGIAPQPVRWYLRFAIETDEETAVEEGWFDVGVPYEWAGAFREEIMPALPCLVVEHDAREFYDRIRN